MCPLILGEVLLTSPLGRSIFSLLLCDTFILREALAPAKLERRGF